MRALVSIGRLGDDLGPEEATAAVAAGLRSGGADVDELPLGADATFEQSLSDRLPGYDVLVTGEAEIPVSGDDSPALAAARLAEAATVSVIAVGARGEVPTSRLHEFGLGRFVVAGDAEALAAAGEQIAGQALPGACIWRPSAEMIEGSQMTEFTVWAEDRFGRSFDGYAELHHWSVTELEEFWGGI
ncbi:MAG: hypothetical protein AB7T48_13750, partial [Solirubrobacterales bacterium]